MLRQWRIPRLGALSFLLAPCPSFFIHSIISNSYVCFSWAVKRHPKLKSRYRQRVKATIEYAKTIDDFDDLVDPRIVALHCLGLEPSAYVLRTIEIEEKKSEYSFGSSLFFLLLYIFFNKCFPLIGIMMKFNQGMYAKMRAKKNEPLSTLRVRTMRIVKKGVSITPATPDTETTRIASLATSIEKIAPLRKKQRVANKGKNKADSRSSSVWDDAGLVLARAQKAFTAEELRAFSGISSKEVVGRHLHKLVQVVYLCKFILSFFFFLHCSEVWVLISSTGESLHITSKYLTQEAKVAFAVSRVEALEVENSKLKKDLIAAIDEANTFKEKAKVLGDDLRAERQLTLEKDE